MNQVISIEDCASAIIEKMRELNYSEASIKTYRHIYDDFLLYCNERDNQYFNEETAIHYASEKTGLELVDLTSNRKDTIKYIVLLRSLRLLGEYSRTHTFVSRFSRFHDPLNANEHWQQIYNRYMVYISNQCDYAESTIIHKELTVRLMIHIFMQLNVNRIDDIDKSAIETIVSKFISDTPKTVTHKIGEMKHFFNFCFNEGIAKTNISYLFPVIKMPHSASLPASWEKDEVNQLLSSIDTASVRGKRDYAILLIAAKLGLRAIDIINLELSDLNFETKVITIRQKKTQNTITLPLLNDIGWALIDYIKNGRPQTGCQKIFISLKPPFDGLKKSASLERIFTSRMREAGLRIKRTEKCGIHSLRHTLGSVLLENETPLPVISQILGHQSIKSTETYIRINIEGLNECPIDPDRVFEHEL